MADRRAGGPPVHPRSRRGSDPEIRDWTWPGRAVVTGRIADPRRQRGFEQPEAARPRRATTRWCVRGSAGDSGRGRPRRSRSPTSSGRCGLRTDRRRGASRGPRRDGVPGPAVWIDASVRPRSRPSRISRRSTSRCRWPRSTPVAAALPGIPSVACFDTAFHATHPCRGRDLRAAARVARSLAAAAVRLSRPVARLRRASSRRAVGRAGPTAVPARDVPPRSRGIARGGA